MWVKNYINSKILNFQRKFKLGLKINSFQDGKHCPQKYSNPIQSINKFNLKTRKKNGFQKIKIN